LKAINDLRKLVSKDKAEALELWIERYLCHYRVDHVLTGYEQVPTEIIQGELRHDFCDRIPVNFKVRKEEGLDVLSGDLYCLKERGLELVKDG